MKNEIRVIQIGMGPIGCSISRYLSEKKNIRIVAAIDKDPKKVGKPLFDITELTEPASIEITNNYGEVFRNTDADIAILTTHSKLAELLPQIEEISGYGLDIISTCEELAFPWEINPDLANKIDQLARQNNVTILGTGVNPGFLMDFLPITLTSVCRHVKKIQIERILDAGTRRLPFQKKVGAGLSVDEFSSKVKEKKIRHVGLLESLYMIAHRLGWKLDEVKEIINPVIADKMVNSDEFIIQAGSVRGIEQYGFGYMDNEAVIILAFKAVVGAQEVYDRINITGIPNIDMVIKDGVDGDIATGAIVVNAIPVVISAQPGLKTMIDLHPISYFS